MKSWGTTYFLIMTSVFLLSRRSPLWMGIPFQLANFWKTGDFEIGSVVVAVFFGGEWKSWTGRACWRSSGPSGEVAPELPEGSSSSSSNFYTNTGEAYWWRCVWTACFLCLKNIFCFTLYLEKLYYWDDPCVHNGQTFKHFATRPWAGGGNSSACFWQISAAAKELWSQKNIGKERKVDIW